MKRILISRTDSIGDTVVTLPMVGVIKKKYPDCFIGYLGQSYTKDIVALCKGVDAFYAWDQWRGAEVKNLTALSFDVIIHVFPRKEIVKAAFRAGITIRIGTTGRWWNWLYCNKKVIFSRKGSSLHESQLNIKLLAPLGVYEIPTLESLSSSFGLIKKEPSQAILSLIKKDKINVILHPKSKGSALEWPIEKYRELIQLLPENRYHFFVTGVPEEAKDIQELLTIDAAHVTSMIGKFSLEEFVSFIGEVDALVAASTGPLHVAGVIGKCAIGLFSSKRPMHPGRWRPLGANVHVLVSDPECVKCQSKESCNCIELIAPEKVKEVLEKIS